MVIAECGVTIYCTILAVKRRETFTRDLQRWIQHLHFEFDGLQSDLQKGEQEFVYLEVHFPFWVQVCARIYIVCGKITKTGYCFQLKVSEQVDTAALMIFNFIGLESRGIRNPATKYIEASELDPNHVTFFHENGKADSPDTICKLNFLPWQSKNEYEQLLSQNPSCILTPATSAAILANRDGNSNDNDI